MFKQKSNIRLIAYYLSLGAQGDIKMFFDFPISYNLFHQLLSLQKINIVTVIIIVIIHVLHAYMYLYLCATPWAQEVG